MAVQAMVAYRIIFSDQLTSDFHWVEVVNGRSIVAEAGRTTGRGRREMEICVWAFSWMGFSSWASFINGPKWAFYWAALLRSLKGERGIAAFIFFAFLLRSKNQILSLSALFLSVSLSESSTGEVGSQ